MTPRHAEQSFIRALNSECPQVLVGLDERRVEVSSLLYYRSTPTQRAVVHYSGSVDDAFAGLTLSDTFGTPLDARWQRRAQPDFDDEYPNVDSDLLNRVSTAPESEVEQAVKEVWQRVLGRETVGLNDNFFELGGNSLLAAELLGAIQKRFGHRFHFSDVLTLATVSAMSAALDTGGANSDRFRSHLLVPLQPHGHLPPLFGVHPLFGLVYPYAELARKLGSDQPFYGLRASGFIHGETQYRSISEMASAYVQAIKTVQPNGPYYLAGWSLGALIALEMAQQLNHSDESIGCLAIIDQATDSVQRFLDEVPVRIQLKRFSAILRAAMAAYDVRFDTDSALLSALAKPILLAGFVKNIMWPMLRIAWFNRNAAIKYEITRFEGQIILLHTGDPEFTNTKESHLGWDSVATNGVDVHRLTGHHFNLHQTPHVDLLANALRAALSECRVRKSLVTASNVTENSDSSKIAN